MSTIDVNGIRNLTDLLNQLPGGKAALVLATRLGVFNEGNHQNSSDAKRAFPHKYSDLGDDDLSDANAYWNAELGRASELLGLLEGQKVLTTLEGKNARFKARSAARTRLAANNGGKIPTAGVINDEAENDVGVQASNEIAGLLEMTIASVKAYKDACTSVVAGISREISFRQDQYKASLRAR